MSLLYTKMKIFHYIDKIKSLSKENNNILAPIQVRIKPTNVCKHNCWYCAYRADNLQLGQDMDKRDYISKEKMFEIINDFENIGVASITFSGGGDPFYYPYLLETIKKLSNTKIKFASLTHGAELKNEIAELFALYGSWIRISIDGWDDKSYSEYRGVKIGTFSKVIENIKNFKKFNGKCLLGISIIVDQKNYLNIFNMINKFSDLGIDSIKISPCFVSNDSKENNNFHKEIFNIVKEQIERAKNNFKKIEIFDSYYLQLDTAFEKEYNWCPYLQITPVIGADLNIYTCHDKAYTKDGLLGSIKEKSFKEIWFSDKNNFFNINPVCDCKHHCIVNEKNKMIIEYLDADKEHLEFV